MESLIQLSSDFEIQQKVDWIDLNKYGGRKEKEAKKEGRKEINKEEQVAPLINNVVAVILGLGEILRTNKGISSTGVKLCIYTANVLRNMIQAYLIFFDSKQHKIPKSMNENLINQKISEYKKVLVKKRKVANKIHKMKQEDLLYTELLFSVDYQKAYKMV